MAIPMLEQLYSAVGWSRLQVMQLSLHSRQDMSLRSSSAHQMTGFDRTERINAHGEQQDVEDWDTFQHRDLDHGRN
jgi:hypothetical protein